MLPGSFSEQRKAEQREAALTSAVSVAASPSYQATKLAQLVGAEAERLGNRTRLKYGDPIDLHGTAIQWAPIDVWETLSPNVRYSLMFGYTFVPTTPPAQDYLFWPEAVRNMVSQEWSGDYASIAHKGILGPFIKKEPYGPTGVIDSANQYILDQLLFCGYSRVMKGEICELRSKNFFELLGQAFEYIAQAISTVVSFIPGVGTAVSAIIQGGIALANGKNFGEALIAGIKGSLPGGPIAKAAFDIGQAVLEGKPIDEIIMSALPIPPEAKELLKRGMGIAKDIAEGKPITEILIQEAYPYLPQQAKDAILVAQEAGASLERQGQIIFEYAEMVLPPEERDALNVGMAAGYADALKRERMLMTSIGVKGNTYRSVDMATENQLMSALRMVTPSFSKNTVNKGTVAAVRVTPERVGAASQATLDKFARAGFEVSKSDRIVEAGRLQQVNDNARKGYDIAIGALHGVAHNPDIAWIRNALPMQIAQVPGQKFPPGQRQGFDLGHALHVGRLTAKLPDDITDPVAAYAFLMTRGISNMTTGDFTPEQKAEAVRETIIDEVAKQGVQTAINQVQDERKGFWAKVKEFFGF